MMREADSSGCAGEIRRVRTDRMAADQRNSGAIADPDKVIWVRPETVKFKITGSKAFKIGLAGVLPGDWDLQRQEIERTAKYRSIVQHFTEGKAWEETELFSKYADRLRRGEVVRGCHNLDQLKNSYVQMDQLFLRLKIEGFILPRSGKRSLPHIHIARDGEILFGRAGNHRFTMARILKLEKVPCIVHTRHETWQDTREKMLDFSWSELQKSRHPALMDHPDLADILSPDTRRSGILRRVVDMVRGERTETK
jgi:hypothetical protein